MQGQVCPALALGHRGVGLSTMTYDVVTGEIAITGRFEIGSEPNDKPLLPLMIKRMASYSRPGATKVIAF